MLNQGVPYILKCDCNFILDYRDIVSCYSEYSWLPTTESIDSKINLKPWAIYSITGSIFGFLWSSSTLSDPGLVFHEFALFSMNQNICQRQVIDYEAPRSGIAICRHCIHDLNLMLLAKFDY